MAVRLYRDAALAGFIDWRIPDIPLDPESASQTAFSPALPHAQPAPSRPPSQAFRPSQASHASHNQHLQSSSSLPRSNGHSHARGRAFEPEGPSNSPSAAGWNPPSSSRARPNPSSASGVSRLQSDLLMHPSTSFRGLPEEEEDLSLSQRLSQAQSLSQQLSQSASQPLHGRPLTQQPPVRDRKEADVLQVMQITDCSCAKAERVSVILLSCVICVHACSIIDMRHPVSACVCMHLPSAHVIMCVACAVVICAYVCMYVPLTCLVMHYCRGETFCGVTPRANRVDRGFWPHKCP